MLKWFSNDIDNLKNFMVKMFNIFMLNKFDICMLNKFDICMLNKFESQMSDVKSQKAYNYWDAGIQ